MIPAWLLTPIAKSVLVGVLTVAVLGGGILYLRHQGAESERAKQREKVNDAADDRRKIDDKVRDAPDADLDRWLRKPARD